MVLSTADIKDNQSTTDDYARDYQGKDQGTETEHQIVEDPCIPSVELQFEKLSLELSDGVIASSGNNDVIEEGGANIYTEHCTSLEPANENRLTGKKVNDEPYIIDLTGQVTGNLSEEVKRKSKQKNRKKGNKGVSHGSLAVVGASKQAPGQEGPSIGTGRSCVASMAAGQSKVLLQNQEQPICRAHQGSLRDADWEVVFSAWNNHMSEEGTQLKEDSLSPPSGWDQEAGSSIKDGWDVVVGALVDDNAIEPGYGNGAHLPGEPKVIGTGSVIGVVCPNNAPSEHSPSDIGWETVTRGKGKAVRAQQQDEVQQQTGRGKLLNGKIQNQIKAVEVGAQGTVDLKSNGRKLGGTTVTAIQAGQALGNARQAEQASSACVTGRDKSGSIPKDNSCLNLRETELQKPGISSYRDAAHPSSLSGNGVLMPCSSKLDTATVLRSLLPPVRGQASDEQHGCIADVPVGSIPSVRAEDGSDYEASNQSDNQYSDLDDMDDYSDDDILSDDFNSDVSEQSHRSLKNVRCFQGFFKDLETLSNEQIQEHDRQWHCPVCQGGMGAVDWYRGLGPLIVHAQTMKSRRVKLHRVFKKVLEEELRQIGLGASAVDERPFGGKWHGLDVDNEAQNPLIVWPPMVIVQNTQLEMDDQEKWVGMGNKELLEYFKEYNPMRPRHAYGPQGHRGMSILMFGESPTGYHDAQRLDKHFRDARRGRDPWNNPGKLLYHPGGGGKRILYGYMASKADLEIFNRHHKGRTLLKYEVKRLQEVVLEPMHRMHDQDKQVLKLQSKVDRKKEVCETLMKTVSTVCHNLLLREQELKILRTRAEEQSIRNREEQDELEEYFRVERDQLTVEVTEKEEELVKLQEAFDQAHLQQCQKLELERSNIPKEGLSKDDLQQQQSLKEKEIAREREMVEGSLCDAKAFEAKREKMQQCHHELRLEFQHQQQAAALAFEQQLLDERAKLLTAYQLKSKVLGT